MNNKKVGILTFSYSTNPGSVLQAFALQKVLNEQLSCDAHIINYHKQEAGKPQIGKTVFCRPFRNWTPKNILKWTIRIIEHPFRMRPYKKFFKKYYNGYPTKRIIRNELPSLEEEYDKFIVGSDQVWNLNSWNVDESFLLDFINNNEKKVSYAASFGGKDIPSDKIDIAKTLINDFSHISVRELSGLEIISSLTNKKATLVLDPSLLLEKDEYLKLTKKPKQEKYVLLYLREESPDFERLSINFAKSQNLSFLKIIKHRKCLKNGKPGKTLSPQEWLGYISNAEYVLTNSFHGICFSIIFEKQFYVFLLQKVSTQTNPRMQSALSVFDLENRLISKEIDSTNKIDYNKVNTIKHQMQEISLDFLIKALEMEKQL